MAHDKGDIAMTRRPPKLTDDVNWRDVPEDDYYRAFANPLPKSWYFLASLAKRVGEGLLR